MDHERCAQCGFDGGAYDAESLVDAISGLGPRWRDLLEAAGSELRVRPHPGVWSAIEYAAHSRDITALHVFGVEQALRVDEPAFPAIAEGFVDDVAGDYAGADPVTVAAELATQASLLATTAARSDSATWSRGLTVGDDRIDVRRLLEHALHDSVHHLDDVERGLAHIRS